MGIGNPVVTPRRLGNEAREGLSRLRRDRRHGEVAAAQRLCMHRSPPRRKNRWQLANDIPQFHHGKEPFVGRTISGARVRRTRALHGSSRIPICPAKNLARTVLGMDVFRSAPYHDDEIYEPVEALWAVLARSDLHSRAVQRLRHHSSATIRNWRR